MAEKVEIFVRRLRWEAYHFRKENRRITATNAKTLGSKQ